jgi:3-phenylpropionate/trans-cinnamate dioxygenase ferredoxin reductase subunit
VSEIEHVLIVGGGLAGANAAFALREEGFGGRVTLLGDEDEWPYERPPMSKGYLRGEDAIEKALVHPASDYDAQRIDLRRAVAATSIDVARRTATTTDGELAFDALVLATGAAPRRLEVPGAELPGVVYLRDRADSDALREAASKASEIVVIGGGWIGSEVSASLRQLGHSVTFLTSRERPLEHVLGTEIAEVYKQAHQENGVRFVTGRVERLIGTDRVEAVETHDRQRLPADLVVVGVGAAPRIDLADGAGLGIQRGAVAVDERLRTSAPSIYAIGDVASAWNPRYARSLHLEHWDNAIEQGKAVAKSILGREVSYDRVPYFYSDQYDLGMEYRGFAPEFDEVVVRGDLQRREFHAFWLQRGRVAAAMNVNLWDDGDELQSLVESRATVDTHRLADAEVPLAAAA